MRYLPLKVFTGERETTGYGRVLMDGKAFTSPYMVAIKQGHPFSWEWFGVYPVQSQLALAMLLEVVSLSMAIYLHQEFAWEIVQHFDRDRWTCDTSVIADWVATFIRDLAKGKRNV